METKTAKITYTPAQVQQAIDAARENINGCSHCSTNNFKPCKTALELLQALKDGEFQIKDLEVPKVAEPPARNLYERVKQYNANNLPAGGITEIDPFGHGHWVPKEER